MKRSPVPLQRGSTNDKVAHHIDVSVEEEEKQPSDVVELSAQELAQMSVIGTDNGCSILMEQPLPKTSIPANITGNKYPNPVKNIEISEKVFDSAMSPILNSVHAACSRVNRISGKKETTKPIRLSVSPNRNSCIAPTSSNFCDDEDDEDGSTEPLEDIINRANITHKPASPNTSNINLNKTTDSARKYATLMTDCSDLLADIENMLA